MTESHRPARSVDSLPRWLSGVIGGLGILLGAAIIGRPTTSLGALALLIGAGLVLAGVLELLRRDEGGAVRRPGAWQIVAAALWIVAGILVLVLPGLTVRVTAIVVGAALIVNGILSLISTLRRDLTVDARVAGIALGLAEVIFGILALGWPDITLLVVAVVFGAWLVVVGIVLLTRAIRGTRRRPRDPDAKPGWLRRWTQTIAAILAVLLAVGAAVLGASFQDGSPVVDEFYAAPRTVPPRPGQLVRAEPFTREIPANAIGWRILYTTTHGDGSPALASGLVVVPRDGDGPWPVVDWAHGTTGFAENCAPSLATQPFESGAFFLLDRVIDEGWALVATDYVGLGTEGPHPYLIGQDTGRAVLDAARAARQLRAANLSAQNVVWGHSQGGGGALWTGAIATDYAPDVEIEGVAALAPASDLLGLVGHLPDVPGGSVFASYVVSAYAAFYPDVRLRDVIRPGAEVTLREMAKRCLAAPGILVSVLAALALSGDPEVFSVDPTTGAVGERLRQNVPPPTVAAPLLLAQGATDALVLPEAQDAYVASLCAAGQPVDYRRYAGLGHIELVAADSPLVPDLLAWTRDRLDQVPVPAGCSREER